MRLLCNPRCWWFEHREGVDYGLLRQSLARRAKRERHRDVSTAQRTAKSPHKGLLGTRTIGVEINPGINFYPFIKVFHVFIR